MTKVEPPDRPPAELILAIVRGEAHWSQLQRFGMSVQISDVSSSLNAPGTVPEVEATAQDIARGILAFRDDPTALRAWAKVMLMASFIGFSDLEHLPYGEALIESLWDAAEGLPPAQETLAIAQTLIESSH